MKAGDAGAVLALALTAHGLRNLRLLRTPPPAGEPAPGPVAVLLPVRDERERVAACVAAVLRSSTPLTLWVLDDGSADGTADVVRAAAAGDRRLRLLEGRPLPAGWLGKPHACQQLCDAALAELGSDPEPVLVFLDADVLLAPDGLARAVGWLRDVDLVCPYPRQEAHGLGQRLVQPLLQWSWLTFLPLRRAERSARPSLSAANGQLLLVRAGAYRRAGGHGAVRGEVLEDLALVRAVKRAGGRAAMADGTELATCRMYRDWAQLREGYRKSLWSAFGPPPAAAALFALLGLAYLAPPAALLRRGGLLPAAGTAAAVAGRAVMARRVGGRVWPDSAGHPLSVLLLAWLTAGSHRGHRAGSLRWRGRPV